MIVSQFQFTDWPATGICTSPQIILNVLDCIGRVQRKTGKGPVVVHCRLVILLTALSKVFTIHKLNVIY